jgi:hypothetical protein
MKCMILTYASQQDYDGIAGQANDLPAWLPEDFAAMGAFMDAVNRQLVESGELIEGPGVGCAAAHQAAWRTEQRAVRHHGPYADTQDALAGYWIVEGDSFDLATEIAGRLVGCTGPEHVVANAYADVRPIVESAAEVSVPDEGR